MNVNLERALAYLQALEAGKHGAELLEFFDPQIVQEELPNRMLPAGARRDLDAIIAGSLTGQQLMRSQRYIVHNALAMGDSVALEVEWIGVLAIDLAQLKAGAELKAHIGIFLHYKDQKIITQRNYDCYEPF